MIIKDYDIVDAEFIGDLLKVTTAQELAPTLQEVAELRQHGNHNGFSKNRQMRHIARIPDIELIRHPEWQHDSRLMLKWLESPEGSRYVTNKPNTGRSGKIVIK